MSRIFPALARRLRRLLRGPAEARRWPSETSKCRTRLSPYCQGNGLDIGPGGDPIVPGAVRVDLPSPYSHVGGLPPQLCGDASRLPWFRDECLDYVFSSHVLEDFDDPAAVLREWLRVVRPGGLLILYCPDEQTFREHCRRTGQPYNPHHKHAHFSLAWVKEILALQGGAEIVHEANLVDVYSWELVIRKLGGVVSR